MATNTTFTFATPDATAANQFDWSAATNWANGTVPSTAGHASLYVGVGPSASSISYDNLSGLTISQLAITQGATVEIAPGNTLTATGGLRPNGGTAGHVVLAGTNTTLVLGGAAPDTNGVGIQLTGGLETIGITGVYSGSITAPITGFGSTDRLDLTPFTTITSVTDTGNVLVVAGSYNYGPNIVTGSSSLTFTNFSTVAGTTLTTVADGHGGTYIQGAVCYAAGTRLLTPTGERLVEDLHEGDLVLTQDGDSTAPRPVTWVGQMRVDLARHPRPETAAPIRIRRGAFAENVPHRDLLLSPEHCVLAGGRLIAAKCLVNGTTIVQDMDRKSIQYFHIETAPHSIVLAEGLPAETYLDTGNRAMFDNAGQALILHPEFHINTGLRNWEEHACAPLAATQAEIEPTWRRLAARAEALGFQAPALATTADAAPRLIVGGRELAPIEADASRLAFLLPEGAADAILVSRFGSPADTAPYLNDHRRLGISIHRMVLRAGTEERVIAADDPALTQGWHKAERSVAGGTWRWTEGRAHLPLGLSEGPAILELHLAGAMTYRVDSAEAIRQAA